MRRKSLRAGAIAIAGVLAIGVPVVGATASTAATSSGATITCTFQNYNPTPTQSSGVTFASISCPEPFGPGVQAGTYSATVNATTGAVMEEGTYTNWYAAGTTYGTFSQTSATATTFKGTFTDTGGTGAFKGIKGTGTLTCSTINGGATTTCTTVFPKADL